MYWGKRGAPERIFINFEYELNKGYVLGGREAERIFINFEIGLHKGYVLAGREAPKRIFISFEYE